MSTKLHWSAAATRQPVLREPGKEGKGVAGFFLSTSYHPSPVQMAARVSPGQSCSRRNREKQKELSLEYRSSWLNKNSNYEGAFSSHPEDGLE